MLAVLLAAVLTAGMVSNAVPASVLAQKGSVVASVRGSDVELTEEETESAEETNPGEPQPDGGTEPETIQSS